MGGGGWRVTSDHPLFLQHAFISVLRIVLTDHSAPPSTAPRLSLPPQPSGKGLRASTPASKSHESNPTWAEPRRSAAPQGGREFVKGEDASLLF